MKPSIKREFDNKVKDLLKFINFYNKDIRQEVEDETLRKLLHALNKIDNASKMNDLKSYFNID